MVGAYPCRCQTEPKPRVPKSRGESQATVDKATIRRLVREEIEPALQRLPASDAERVARDYLDLLDENAKDS
jgi:hypothetical protein